jgi:ubiquitin-like modifier-activating enzyme ATG7
MHTVFTRSALIGISFLIQLISSPIITTDKSDPPTMNEEPWIIKFVPLSTSVESSFWVRYCREKLDTIRLSEEPIDVSASYGNDGRLECREDSLAASSCHRDRVMVKGRLVGCNTIETFQQKDKNQFLRELFLPMFAEDSLTSFVLLTYADLKSHKVLYWFAIPAVTTKPGCSIRAIKQDLVYHAFGATLTDHLYSSFQEKVWTSISPPPFFLFSPSVGCLAFSRESYATLCNVDGSERVVFGFLDSPAALLDQQPMGWSMRNLVASLCLHWNLGGQCIQVLSFRPKLLRKPLVSNADDSSILVTVKIPVKDDFGDDHKAVGWELNARGKPGPRWVNLRPLLDNQHLAIQAADLNLKLMKWRMIPNLDVERLQGTKVLLLGAGTLGCNVARTLLGWGVRKFTIVDNGKVSYSNPVRQSLFTLEDCQGGEGGGGQPKAVAAAKALSSIAADVDAEGIVMSIPMPGHADKLESIETAVEQLDKMVQDCDVVYLLTDTRESRWLPTVMAAAHNKMLLNAALGLDSWLVMRHGGNTTNQSTLGCYFCNDVVAPENSMKNRTLDQQCTVTRPGLAPVASSMAVELMVALLHHPLLHNAPAPRPSTAFSPTVDDESASPLGIMPHQIRGSLVSYTMMTPSVPAFSCCTGCSPLVIQAYQNDKVGFTYQVARSDAGAYLDEVSGLQAFRAEASNMMEEMVEDWDSDD